MVLHFQCLVSDIDFGHFLGNFKTKTLGGIKVRRERTPFVFTPQVRNQHRVVTGAVGGHGGWRCYAPRALCAPISFTTFRVSMRSTIKVVMAMAMPSEYGLGVGR